MNKELANPFAAILQQAAAAPADTGAVAQYQKRFENTSQAVIILADVSSSMAEKAGAKRKIDILTEALRETIRHSNAWKHLDTVTYAIAFNSICSYIPIGDALPAPAGSTALHLALEEAARHRPRRTLVISDGRPDSEQAALDAADRLTGRIDVIYCGPDSDREAIAFMHKLARLGGGTVIVEDIVKNHTPALAPAMKKLLALSSGGSQ